ncbi:Copper-exporting P-type ATPase B [uncultured archaeon]|nr:Copper-exporting P-type ATPase B [uncultured archaeon]
MQQPQTKNQTPENTQKLAGRLREYSLLPAEEVLKQMGTKRDGISVAEAHKRLLIHGHNEVVKNKKRGLLIQFAAHFVDPLVLVLFVIAAFSIELGQTVSALIVSLMAVLSVILSFVQEYRASKEAEKLTEMVRTMATVVRDGKSQDIKIKEIVPGDIIDLYAGDMIPADLRVFFAKDLFINQSTLTGESFPVEKVGDAVQSKGDSLTELTNIAFMGTSVQSGTGFGVVVQTAGETQFGELAKKVSEAQTETGFEKGINDYVWLVVRFMLLIVIAVFAINAVLKGNVTEALMFSLAVAVGLTPEMLPMFVTVNLSKGAIAMSKKQVIVKRLKSIQNFGAMSVLCTDKTGTLTLDEIVLERHIGIQGNEKEEVLLYSYLNSYYQTGLKNQMDKAVLKHGHIKVDKYRKVDEIPFDFSRKVMSVVVEEGGKHLIISKGAPEEVFKKCAKYEKGGDTFDLKEEDLPLVRKYYDKLSAEGFRVLAVAYRKPSEKKEAYSKADEKDLTLKGYIAFLDPPRPTARKALHALKKLDIEVKIITGDNDLVTKKICEEVGLEVTGVVDGARLEGMSDEQLKETVKATNVFVRMSPLQKERVVRALQKNNHVVGYLGDGINDAPSLKASDVGISVNNAADIAKESADIILIEKNLMVLKDGVIEGRKTFGNLNKYIRMGSSSNFGNMLSMTGASIILPFLPMAPIQILLNNFLYDMSQTAIPTDDVDEEYLSKPRPWDIKSIKRFMVFFGPISSLFDFMTFGVFLFLKAPEQLFHTCWFLESLCTQTLVIHVIRTGKIPFIESKPSTPLALTSLLIIAVALFLPYSIFAPLLGFKSPPFAYLLIILGITAAYLVVVQGMKIWFKKKYGYD